MEVAVSRQRGSRPHNPAASASSAPGVTTQGHLSSSPPHREQPRRSTSWGDTPRAAGAATAGAQAATAEPPAAADSATTVGAPAAADTPATTAGPTTSSMSAAEKNSHAAHMLVISNRQGVAVDV